jgi:hypothetical protein
MLFDRCIMPSVISQAHAISVCHQGHPVNPSPKHPQLKTIFNISSIFKYTCKKLFGPLQINYDKPGR